jgi:hypothetical protein
MDAILNELSVRPSTTDDPDSRASELVRSVRLLLSHGLNRTLRSTRAAPDYPFTENLSLRRWLFSSTGNREEKSFLARLMDKAPYVDDLEASAEATRHALLEFRASGDIARGLGVAHLHDVPAVSFRGIDNFEGPTVELNFTAVEADRMFDRVARVVHIVTPEHVTAHRAWLEERLQRSVKNGAELWERRETLFPPLDFCHRVEKQLRSLSGNEPFFTEAVRHLYVLSQTALYWQNGEFDPPLRWSYESAVTLANRDLCAKRMFICPDSIERVFSPHSKMGYGAKRLLFLPDASTRRVWIGHIGDHLPTATTG